MPSACVVQVRHVLAGTAARTMSQAVIHPIDTIKTRLQVNKLTAPLQLQLWRSHSKAHKIELFLGRRRVLSLRNWLVQVRFSAMQAQTHCRCKDSQMLTSNCVGCRAQWTCTAA